MTSRQALKVLAEKFGLFNAEQLTDEQIQMKRALTALSITVNEYEREKRLKKYT